ncbi:MAG: GTPase HflX [Halobacteriovoraceae bacterium]|nr:GTPase HflX [Halobacteriovoraceae bacterium]
MLVSIVFDNDYKLIPKENCILVSVQCNKLTTHSTQEKVQESINELNELMTTLDMTVKSEFIQTKNQIEPGTIIGTGKLKEITEFAKENKVNLLVFDLELTAGQIQKIKKLTNISVIDRCQVILEIFAKHARTKESKIQIEISRLKYLLPRLMGFWTHFSRQRGGVGVRGGEGEQQIELDRRIIRKRISVLEKELKEVINSREQQGKRRKNTVMSAALVGYTNVGKSSLMNRLCYGEVLEENKLFATLDSTFRTLSPNTKPPLVLIDTVGFLNNLPNTLIEGFKTTLESAREADLLIIVCDISSKYYDTQIDVTKSVLTDLKIDEKETIIVFNKTDLNTDPFLPKILKRKYKNSFFVSSFNEREMDTLREKIINIILDKLDHYDLFLPYKDGEGHSKLLNNTNIINTSNHETGIFYRVRTPKFVFERLNLKPYLLLPGHQYENGLE